MNDEQLQAAFDHVFDHGLVSHGFADHMRDYDLYVRTSTDPRSGLAPELLRYRFTHCVRALVTTAVGRAVWARSLDDVLVDYDGWLAAGEPDGYVWGVRSQDLYPGITLQPATDETREWSRDVGVPFRRATVGTNGHDIELVFVDLRVDPVPSAT